MYLLPIEMVKPHINEYYLTFRDGSELLGFMACSTPAQPWASYYSVDTPKGRVVPVFYVPDMVFDSEGEEAQPGPALFFQGCDDGHTGLKFASKDDALKWVEDCPYHDFELMFRDAAAGTIPKLYYHN